MRTPVLKPTNDAVFKILFGSSTNTNALRKLIEGVLQRPISKLEILNPFTDVKSLSDKKTILDIKAKATDGMTKETYNVELQVRSEEYFHNRSLYYWAQSYGAQLNEGESYEKLHRHICINFLNFQLLDHEKLHSKYVIMEADVETRKPLTDHLELNFVQMPCSRYNSKQELPFQGTALEKWVYFLRYGAQISDEEAKQLDPVIATTYEKFKELQGHPDLATVISMHMREKDDLAKIQFGRKQMMAETIAKRVKHKGYVLPKDHIKKLLSIPEDRLDALYEFVLFQTDDIEQIKIEIKSYIS